MSCRKRIGFNCFGAGQWRRAPALVISVLGPI
jgi:hypothetical protein